VDPVALATGEVLHPLLLVGALEGEPGQIGPGGDLAATQVELVQASAHFLEDRLLSGERIAALVDVGQLHRVTEAQLTRIRLLLPGDHPEERRLPRPVRPDHSHQPVLGQLECQVVDQQPVAVGLAQSFGLQHQAAQARPGGNGDLSGGVALLGVLGHHLVVGSEPGLALRLAGVGARPHPLQLVLELLLPRRLLLLLQGQPLLLLVQPAGVVALPRHALAAIELEDPPGDVVQEVPVVGDADHRPRVILKGALEPGHALGVEVVGRLVEEKEVRLLEKDPAQRHPALLSAREVGHRRVAGRQPEGVHRHLQRPVELPAVAGIDGVLELGLLAEELLHRRVVHRLAELIGHGVEPIEDVPEWFHTQFNVALHVQRSVELGLLWEKTDPDRRIRPRRAEELGVLASHDSQQGRLPGAVRADHPDLRPGKK
jgi:hypothetical protein